MNAKEGDHGAAPITIIGGGLGGLALGILLRRRGVPVTLFESGSYPRHRVCGEFISGRGVQLLEQLDPGEAFLREHTRVASNASFHDERRCIGRRDLPSRAVCVSRYRLDEALAQRFVGAGGELRTGTRMVIDEATAGVVRATGRRARPVDDDGCRWVGLKFHASGAVLDADLEMYVHRDSYVGLCRISEKTVNVCGLFRCRAGEAIDHDALLGSPGSPLHKRLASATIDPESKCAVAGLSLDPEPIDSRVCCVGDAITMIPPITGNGMSMAFESAAIACEPLARYASGQARWDETTKAIAALLEKEFARRLRWAGRLHGLLFAEWTRRALGPVVFRFPGAWRAAFAVTRA